MRRSGKNYTMPAACVLLIAAVIFGKISEDPSRNASEISSENAGESVSIADYADGSVAAAQNVGTEFTLSDISAWDGESYYALANGNEPYFTEAELSNATADSIELSDLDQLGRCSVANVVQGPGITSGVSTEFVPESGTTYVLNTNTMRFHRPSCESVQEMQPENREETSNTRQELIDEGYKPCGSCKP